MLRSHLVFLLILTAGLAQPAGAQAEAAVVDGPALTRALEAVRVEHIEADIHFLASDELAGRDTPSPGLQLAARYLRARLMRLGFQPAGDNGYFDEYFLDRKRLDLEASGATLRMGGVETELSFGQEYFFHPRDVATVQLDRPLVFVGEGTQEDLQGLKLNGAWAVAYDSDLAWRTRRDNVRAAGAGGLVVTPGPDYQGRPYTQSYRGWAWRVQQGSLSLPEAGDAQAPFPQMYLIGALGQELTAAAGEAGQPLEASLAERRVLAPDSQRFTVENVCGLWPGSDPKLKEEVLILSAHYDHVGERAGEIYNGADDNGSGTTGLLAVAEALAAHGPMKRSVLLIWVSGEEKGLLGSRAWTLEPTLPAGYRPVANINMDMIGRNAPDSLLVTPTEALPQYNDLVRRAEANASLEGFGPLGNADEYWSRSDQKSFSDNLGIPVMFLFADLHEDYHRPGDTADKIDYDKIRRVSRLVVRMLADLQGEELL